MALPAWEELQGSPKDGITVDSGPTAERIFLLAWGSKAAFYTEMWNNHRDYPAFAHCHLQGISTEPFSAELCPDAAAMADPASQLATYSGNGGKVLLARVQYGFDWTDADWPTDIDKPNYDAGTELALRTQWKGDVMILPNRDVAYEDNYNKSPGGAMPQHDAKGARLFVSMPEYQVEWKYVDDPPVAKLRGFGGHTNDDVFLGVPAGCLLFQTFELDAGFTLNAADPFNWTVRIVLAERRILNDDTITWNHDYRGVPPAWKEVWFTDGTRRFPQADFSTMFQQ